MAGTKRFAKGCFFAAAMLLMPTLAMAAAPTIDNLPGATDVQSISAKLQGHLVDAGGLATTVQAYWGDNDGMTTVLDWDNTQDLGLTAAGVVTLDVTGLVPNRTYFYRFHATNLDGDTWASPTVSFTTSLNAGPAPLDLLSMYNFMILSGAAITTTGGGTINGDVGAVTQAQVTGVIYVVDASGPAGSVIDVPRLTTAKGDLTTAFNNAAGRTPVPSGTFLNPGSGNLAGLTLVPGLYKFTTTALITGADVTLKGGPNDVWIFQIGTDLQLGSGIKVILSGGAQARNVFWQVGTSAVLGTGSTFKGTILADQSITLMTGATMEGRALAFSAGVTYNGVGSSTPAANEAPVAVNDTYGGTQDTTLMSVAPGVLINDTDNEGNPLTAIKVTDPVHGVLTLNANGSFTYESTLGYSGPDSFTYKANDGTLDSNIATVNINIVSVNTAPVAVIDAYSTDEDTTLTVVVPGVLSNDTDTEGNPLTAIKVTDPTHGVLTLNANGSFTYVPTLNYNGADSFTYKANDGLLDSNTVTVSLTINAVNDAPVTVADTGNTNEDTTLTVVAPGVLGNDTDVEGDTLTAVLVTDVTKGTLTLNSNGSYTYVPNANYNGSDSFTYKANDGTADGNTVTVTLTINAVNDLPVAVANAYSTNKNVTLTVVAPGVLGNDTDVDGDTLTAVLVANVAHGVLTLNANGSFTFVPTTDYVGGDSFTYKANDGTGDSSTVTVTLTILATNEAPVAVVDAYTTAEDTTLTVVAPGVLGNDTDGDGDTLAAVLVTNVSNGTLTLNANGSFVYVPTANYNGPDSFTYKANDGTVDGNTVTVSLTITAVNDAPVAVADSYTTDEDLLLTVAAPGVLANDSDVEGSVLTAALVTNVSNGTLVFNADGSFTYMPDLDYNGADSFTYKANDGTADSAVVTVSLTITPVADVPLWYPEIPYTAVAGFTWYNFELWDRVPTAAGAVRVINTNIHGTGMTTAEEYFLAGNDGLLPGTYYWRYRTWTPETSTYGTTWLPSSTGQLLTVADYGNPLSPIALSASPTSGPAGNFNLSFIARNAQGYDIEITGTKAANKKTLSTIAFMPGAGHVMPFNPTTIRATTLAGPDTVTWRVRGYNPAGKSEWVTGPTITVTAGNGNPVPGVPAYGTMRPEDGAMVTAPEGTAFIAFQWEPVPGAAGYLIHLATHSGAHILNYVDIGNVTRVDTINGAKIALAPGSYQWSLVAYNAAYPRAYGGWNHSPQSPAAQKPLTFEVIADLVAPTMTAATRASSTTANVSWVGTAPATIRVALYYSGAPGGWQILDNRPVTVTGSGTGTVDIGRSWGAGTNYLLLTGKTAGGLAGPRSGLFVLP